MQKYAGSLAHLETASTLCTDAQYVSTLWESGNRPVVSEVSFRSYVLATQFLQKVQHVFTQTTGHEQPYSADQLDALAKKYFQQWMQRLEIQPQRCTPQEQGILTALSYATAENFLALSMLAVLHECSSDAASHNSLSVQQVTVDFTSDRYAGIKSMIDGGSDISPATNWPMN